jgi:exosome complex RNA-binding protein Rrp4
VFRPEYLRRASLLLLKVQLLRELLCISVRINQNGAVAVSKHAQAQYCFATTTIRASCQEKSPNYQAILAVGQGK